jgi:hypothetical protein
VGIKEPLERIVGLMTQHVGLVGWWISEMDIPFIMDVWFTRYIPPMYQELAGRGGWSFENSRSSV